MSLPPTSENNTVPIVDDQNSIDEKRTVTDDAASETPAGHSPAHSGLEQGKPHDDTDDSMNEWPVSQKLKEIKDRDVRSGFKSKELGVTWKNLSVEVLSAESAISENFLSQFNIPGLIREKVMHKPPLRKILSDTHGCVKPGEMLLVLGRPGSGCTTLLNILANRRSGYVNVSGDVNYGSMTPEEARNHKGHIVMNTEEELFYPALTVGQTMDFATRMKIPHNLPEGVASQEEFCTQTKQFLLEALEISHTAGTKVGNEFVRGVSGGERKRVSILETLTTRGSVFCWDNSTRGLDASTALLYAKVIRAMTDILGLSSIVTLYQAGNGIYNLFDKVLVLDEGVELYYGPMQEARPFLEEAGFICREGSNVADFLSGVTVPTERLIRPEAERTFPRNKFEVRDLYQKSSIYDRMVVEYDYPSTDIAKQRTQVFKEATSEEKHPSLPKNSPLMTSFIHQVLVAVIRQYQILWGAKETFIVKQVSVIVQSLVSGSLFYDAPDNSSGLFLKGGACFFALLFNSLIALSEVTESFQGRPVLIKQKGFGFFHPAAFCISQIAADIPILFVQVTLFTIILYFMVGLKMAADAFFTHYFIVFSVTMAMTALFRAIGAAFSTFAGASKVSGFTVTLTVMYTGYMIQKPRMHPWFVWLYWLDPLAYGFEAVLSNELHGDIIPCIGANLIPNGGPEYSDPRYQACAGVPGVETGATSLTGDQYLSALSYSHSRVWRNVGIVWAWWALYVFITVLFTCRWRASSESGPSLLIPRENAKQVRINKDEEAAISEANGGEMARATTKEVRDREDHINKSLLRNTSTFTWNNLCYTVSTPTGNRQLLDNVQGWVKPGMLGALMGSSGAGKTTLLDVLAQRKTAGTINGSVLVDGRPLPVSFQRSAGYCEQLDVHEPFATVREALEFSALLRQSADTPREDKIAYVDIIIDLLELHDIADTLIGTVGAGLSVEQRKRVTIGVELVSKPSILIFLDEPTSGLDGQSAFNTVRFLRKLADVGQAVLVTIHQPSAQLFAQFDTLLLLSYGGKTVYFGDIGDNSAVVKDYFAKYGAPCPPETNPAEHMIDVVSGELSQGRDWHQIWLESPEHTRVSEELDRIVQESSEKPPSVMDDGKEFSTNLWTQTRLVCHRMNLSLYRNTDYVNSKLLLHIMTGLFNGFSFWKIGNTVGDTQLRLFSVFNFIFVAPGALAQLQPLFLQRRDIYETREKRSKMYSWIAFTTSLIVSEVPYLIMCAVLYFVCFYYTVGFESDSNKAGALFFIMLVYEFLYTGIGQFISAYAPNAVFAALVNPVVIGTLVSFCGVLVPYQQLQTFWRYWMYWLDPFNYLMGSMLTFTTWDANIECAPQELAVFDPPSGSTCGDYLAPYLAGMGANTNPHNLNATTNCQVCQYSRGSDYLKTLNLKAYYYGWRDTGIVALFVVSSYSLVYLLMKLRTKAATKSEG